MHQAVYFYRSFGIGRAQWGGRARRKAGGLTRGERERTARVRGGARARAAAPKTLPLAAGGDPGARNRGLPAGAAFGLDQRHHATPPARAIVTRISPITARRPPRRGGGPAFLVVCLLMGSLSFARSRAPSALGRRCDWRS